MILRITQFSATMQLRNCYTYMRITDKRFWKCLCGRFNVSTQWCDHKREVESFVQWNLSERKASVVCVNDSVKERCTQSATSLLKSTFRERRRSKMEIAEMSLHRTRGFSQQSRPVTNRLFITNIYFCSSRSFYSALHFSILQCLSTIFYSLAYRIISD